MWFELAYISNTFIQVASSRFLMGHGVNITHSLILQKSRLRVTKAWAVIQLTAQDLGYALEDLEDHIQLQ